MNDNFKRAYRDVQEEQIQRLVTGIPLGDQDPHLEHCQKTGKDIVKRNGAVVQVVSHREALRELSVSRLRWRARIPAT